MSRFTSKVNATLILGFTAVLTSGCSPTFSMISF
jgi:hypothetical protein